MVASLAALALPPLPEFHLPRLPPIADPTLARTVVSHSSAHQAVRNAQALSLDGRPDDYEKLEFVGDAILGALVTLLLQDLYPHLPPGTATMLKAHLVNNETLAQLCVRYKIMDGLIAADATRYTLKGQIKAQASIFEAYIAGAFYDFLGSDLPGGYDDDNQSTMVTYDGESARDDASAYGMVIDEATDDADKTIDKGHALLDAMNGDRTPPADPLHASRAPSRNTSRAPSRMGSVTPAGDAVESMYQPMPSPTRLPELCDKRQRSNGQAMDYVGHFFRPIFTPVAHFAYAFMREKAEELQNRGGGGVDEPITDAITNGAAAALNYHCMKIERQMPVYEYHVQGVNLWQCVCKVVIEGKTHEAEATRSTKKAAMGVAAWKMGKQLGLDWARE